MSCDCQNQHSSCPQEKKREEYRQAKRKFPLIDNPLANWKCDETFAKTCSAFKPFPPRMTEEEFKQRQDDLLTAVPKEFHSYLSHKAWEDGHACGYEEVITILSSHVDEIQDSIKKFEEEVVRRIMKNMQMKGPSKKA